MRRPLCLLCAAAAVLLVLRGSAENTAGTAMLKQVQETLTEAASKNGYLSLDGTVKDCSVTADGVRLTLNHLIIYNSSSVTEEADSTESDIYKSSSATEEAALTESDIYKSSSVTEEANLTESDIYKSSSATEEADPTVAAYLKNGYLREFSQNSILLTQNILTESYTEKAAPAPDGDICILVSSTDDICLPGDRIHAEGEYYAFEAASNPGQFDAQAYYFAQDTAGSVRDAKLTCISEGGESLSRALYRLRKALRESFARILEDKDARTASAITLGEKGLMEHEWKLVYQEGGIAHIIAISGLHITMVGMTLYRLLRFFGLPFAAAAVPCAFAAACYTLMTGCGVSAVRAFLMFLIWLGAQICGRKCDMRTSVALAAFLILVQDARNAWNSSFLLSFAAILSLAILVPALQEACPFGKARADIRTGRGADVREKIGPALQKAAKSLWMTLGGGLGVWTGTLPVTLAFFYQTAPWSILVNLAVIPLMSAVMASGLISGFAGIFSVPAGMFLAAPLHYLLWLFEALCGLEQKLPPGVWIAGNPGTGRILAYYALLAAAFAAAEAVKRISRADEKRGNAGKPVRFRRPVKGDGRAGKGRERENGTGAALAGVKYYKEDMRAKRASGSRRVSDSGVLNGMRRTGNAHREEDSGRRRVSDSGVLNGMRRTENARREEASGSRKAPGSGVLNGMRRTGNARREEASGSRRFLGSGVPAGARLRKKHRMEKLPAMIWLAACACCIALMAVRLPCGLTVSCLDVGQGDGALLQMPDGTVCLIDGGSSSVSSLWEYRIGQTVKYYGIRTLDYVFLSHADSDHISGVLEYLESYVPELYGNARGITLKNLVLPPAADPEDFEELRQLAAQAGVSVLQMEAGDAVGSESAGWSLTCLAPSSSSLSGDKNEDSMVLRLEYGSFRMLFTGDLEGDAELELAGSGADLHCNVLKVGHHGSKGASSELFLQAVQPDAAVISCGKNNRYGHPARAAVERLLAAGAVLYPTTEYGAVRIRTDGQSYTVSGYLQ